MQAVSRALTAAQVAALAHIRAGADAVLGESLARIEAAGGSPAEVAALTETAREHGRITLNFHPDRLVADGRSVIECLAADGIYRGQWETGISNGGRTAFAGGDRDRWERALFGAAYHADDVLPAERPKYGALNLAGHADGGSPRFGSCHVRLRPEANDRATFSVGDTAIDPSDFGTIDAFAGVVAGMIEQANATEMTLGRSDIGPVEMMRGLRGRPVSVARDAAPGRALDDYIEAQVHGRIDLAVDAEAIVADPSFAGTRTGEMLSAAAKRCDVALEWHAGFQLAPGAIPADFRGPEIPPFAAAICEAYGGARAVLDAEMLGRAAAAVVTGSAPWDKAAEGDRDDILQYIKYVWHVLVRFGEPYRLDEV